MIVERAMLHAQARNCCALLPGFTNPRGLRIQKRILGNLIGYFHTELDQIVHLWGYESFADRERRRALLAADRNGRII
jgi:hypothetical protein